MSPQRIQQKRTKGWRLPPGARSVARPSRYGNPWRVGQERVWTVLPGGLTDKTPRDHPLTAEEAVESYRNSLLADPDYVAALTAELGGRDLACYCPVGAPCHGDVLLAIVNPQDQPPSDPPPERGT